MAKLFICFVLIEISIYISAGVIFLRYYNKYRNKYLKDVDYKDVKLAMKKDFVFGLKISDFIKTFVICFALSFVPIFIVKLFIFEYLNDSVYYNISFINNPLISYILSVFWIGFIIFMFVYIRRTYRSNASDYRSYLIYECFIFGRRSHAKHYPEITTDKIKKHCKTEKILITALTVLLVLYNSVLTLGNVGNMCCFGDDTVTVCYVDYNYSDIKEIYISSAYKPLIGNIQYGEYVIFVLDNGIEWNSRNKEKLSPEQIEIISQKSGIKPVECDTLPDLKTLKTAEKSKHDKIISVDTHFKIAQRDSFDYEYSIYDNEGNTVYHENTKGKLPQIDKLSDQMLDIHLSFGSGIIRHRYYDIENDRLSQEFYYVVALKDDMVAYIGEAESNNNQNKALIIQNIFSKEIYRKEIYLKLSKEPMPIDVAEFSDDMTQLFIKYRDENSNKVEKSIFIN